MAKNNDRWDRFCLEYVKDFDRVRAIKKAGYKCKTNASRRRLALCLLSTNPYVQEKVKILLKGQKSGFVPYRKPSRIAFRANSIYYGFVSSESSTSL